MTVPPHALRRALASDHLTALLAKASPFVAASERERLTLAHLARLTYAAFPSTYKCFYHTTAQQWVVGFLEERRAAGPFVRRRLLALRRPELPARR